MASPPHRRGVFSERGAAAEAAPSGTSRLIGLIQSASYVELELAAREMLAAHPESGFVWKALGVSLWMQGKDALHALEKAADLSTNDAEAHGNLGNALRALGRPEDAAASHRRALVINPRSAEAFNNLGSALRDLGRLDEAVANYRRAVEIRSDFAIAHGNLGSALRSLGRFDEAVVCHRRAVEIRPDMAEGHQMLGDSLLELARVDEAVASYRRALALRPDFAEAYNSLGVALRQQNLGAEAEAACRRALEINPKLLAATILLAQLRADMGEFAEAESLFRRAIAIDAELPEAWAGIAALRTMTRSDALWLAEAQRIAGRQLPPRQESHLRYAIGKYFDDVGDFEQAFHNYRRANELARLHGLPHDRQRLTRTIDLIIHRHDRPAMSPAQNDASASLRPAFIVGMPRSGTTLAEQILASHPVVFGAGEIRFWSDASAMQASGSLMRRLAGDYLRLLEALSPNALRVVDKMPENFMHLGLIHAALPNARIIHMRRDPIDTCLSIYFQNFQAAHSYANDLEDLAHYYSEYLRLMRHWRLVLGEDAILEVPYEGLVEDQETWSRRMVEFLGLPWDPACLDFHRTNRAIITFSKRQARQKISTSSVGRWRNYEKFAGPLLGLMDSAPRQQERCERSQHS